MAKQGQRLAAVSETHEDGAIAVETGRTMRFTFPHSHAYPRGHVAIADDGETGPECLLVFGDGVTVIAAWRSKSDAIHLSVPAYQTAKGTQIAAQNWRLVKRKDGVWRSEAAP